ncbi:hypothetical protein AB837_00489 [bacterium AB1]|nr:hypothetical protein AB837_00489 [bacterium AB1]
MSSEGIDYDMLIYINDSEEYRLQSLKNSADSLDMFFEIYDKESQKIVSKITFSYLETSSNNFDFNYMRRLICKEDDLPIEKFIDHILLIMFQIDKKEIQRDMVYNFIIENNALFSPDFVTQKFADRMIYDFQFLRSQIFNTFCKKVNIIDGMRRRCELIHDFGLKLENTIALYGKKQWDKLSKFGILILLNVMRIAQK